MLIRLLLLLTIVPLVELVILLRLAERFDWQFAVGLVIVTGVIGAFLARREGIKTIGRIRADLESGVVPTGAMAEGALILVAGCLLVTPGLLTDLCGFALLIGPIRRRIRQRLIEAVKRRTVVMHDGRAETFVDVDASSREVSGEIDAGDGESGGARGDGV